MMFGGVFFKKRTTPKYWAIAGIVIILFANVIEFFGTHLFNVDTRGMLHFDNFGLHFNTIAFACTLLFFLFNAQDIEKVGNHVSEYFALIFNRHHAHGNCHGLRGQQPGFFLHKYY